MGCTEKVQPMKSYEVRLRWDDKQAEKLGVKYPGRFQAKEVVASRTPAEAINKAQAINPGYVKQSLRPV